MIQKELIMTKKLMIHPAKAIQKTAALAHDFEVMDEASLKQFIKAVRSFFNAFEATNFNNLPEKHIQNLLMITDCLCRIS